MNHWRESLCGSVILHSSHDEQAVNSLANQGSDVLSCGGNFLPHNVIRSKPVLPFIVHLPNRSEEVLVYREDSDVTRYGTNCALLDDELEKIEIAIQQTK